MLLCCSVAVLEKVFPYPKFISIFIYINIEFIFDLPRINFGTATLQRCVSLLDGSSRKLSGLLRDQSMR